MGIMPEVTRGGEVVDLKKAPVRVPTKRQLVPCFTYAGQRTFHLGLVNQEQRYKSVASRIPQDAGFTPPPGKESACDPVTGKRLTIPGNKLSKIITILDTIQWKTAHSCRRLLVQRLGPFSWNFQLRVLTGDNVSAVGERSRGNILTHFSMLTAETADRNNSFKPSYPSSSNNNNNNNNYYYYYYY